MILRLLIFALFLLTMNAFSQNPPPIETGVSQTLAKWRGANYSDVRYKLNIALEKGAALMRGEIEIRVTLTDKGAKNALILDWRTTQFANDKIKPFADVLQVNESIIKKLPDSGNYAYLIDKEHIIIAPRLLKTGENVIKIEFASPIKTSGAAITRYVDKEDGAQYIYSLFVPSDASTAFPVFDQPDLKARFSLIVDVPKEWKVVSNTDEGVLLEGKTGSVFGLKGFKNVGHTFAETKPISTYVFAFAAGNFELFTEKSVSDATAKLVKEGKVVKDENDTFILDSDIREKTGTRIYVRRSQAEKFKQHAAEVFRLNREGVKFLESYFDYKFPFPKYDLVLIPEFPFGGMEHAGATFLRESSVIFPTEPTKNDLVSRANVIFHEAAHQWFGDTVTMKWFDDLWLKEGFAEFMAYKTLERVMPEYNAWKIFYERNKQAAYLTDSTKGTTPIYQEIPNLSAAKSAYGNIVYRKAPSFLKQAEFYLGADNFQTAVRAFLKKHEFKNAEWSDLISEFEIANLNTQEPFRIKQNLRKWAESWVKQRGLFIIRLVPKKSENSDGYTLEVQSRHSLDADAEPIMKFLTYGREPYRDSKLTLGLELPSPDILKVFKIQYFNGEYYYIFPNYQDYGYGIFLLDEKSRAYVLANIQTEKDDFLRAMMWGSLWDSVREAELAPKDYVELVIKNINVETDESTIQTLLGRVSTAMNYYLSDKQRDELAPKVERLLLNNAQNAKTTGQKITYFRAYQNIASTDDAKAALKMILLEKSPQIKTGEKLDKIGILPKNFSNYLPEFKTKNKFDIATKLVILGDKDAPHILAELEKTETNDEAKRYTYAAKAGISTAANKAKFWNDFTNNKEISESYIESAFANFNSPKQADLTLPYLEKALAELPNLKKNRKIFFVNGWLAAFIGGQKSAEALNIVNKFLADNPNLDKDLRLKILENADGLERAVKIREKW